jgi:hypothetical protein
MGIFNTPSSSYYVPPTARRGGPAGRPTLLGGGNVMADALPEASRHGQQLAQAPRDDRLPPSAPGTWRIELWSLPIAHRGHAFLALVDPNGRVRAELQGLSRSRTTGKPLPLGMDGSELTVSGINGRSDIGQRSSPVATVASGSYDELIQRHWMHGLRAADRISKLSLDYKSHDPAYEIGGDGGHIQNSNSVAFTLGKAMGLDLDSAVRRAGFDRRFSGWGRDLLDPSYKPYAAPPSFAVTNTP